MAVQSHYHRQVKKERTLAQFIPYSSHITPNTLLTREGDYCRSWKIGGIPHEGADPDIIQARMDQLNTLLRSLASSQLALWTHSIRRKASDRLEATYINDFCHHLNKKYYDSFSGYRMMTNELYLTLVYRPQSSRFHKVISKTRSLEDAQAQQQETLRKFDDISQQLESSLRLYEPIALSCYEEEKITYSSLLSFFNFLISGVWQKVRLPRTPLNEYLGTAWIFVGSETIELRNSSQTRYAQALDFKDYTAHTEPGLLNKLLYVDFEYIMTQSFSFLSKHQSKSYLEQQQRQLANTQDGSLTQIEEISAAIDELIQGEFAMGEYHYSLFLFGDSVEEVRLHTAASQAIIQDLGFLASLVTTATDAAFYAQLPANWFYRPRVARLTSKNFAALSSFHNFSTGKRDNNPWGQAVTLLKIPSGQPIYFNFHATLPDEDARDKKALGNTCIIGQSGSGKTVLLSFLLCQAQKFKHNAPQGYTDIFFDKDRGAELAIRALGGQYLILENGKPTGFNPFQVESTPENHLFLEQWITQLITTDQQPFSAQDECRISNAVRTVMRMPKELRRLSTFSQNITEGLQKSEREHSLAKRLSRWCQGGSLAWVFDNAEDTLNFTTHSNYGIDGTTFLDNETIRTPISLYLLHRMESIIDGRRFIYTMDEFWKWLADPVFSGFAFNKQKTIRKQNGLGVFATQSPSDVLRSDIARTIIEQCATEIYLPNPKADYHDYVDGFKVTQSEFDIIKNLGENSRLFLIKQGHLSAIAQLDLQGFEDELAILSGSTDNIALLDDIIEQAGHEPSHWLPLFHARRKERIPMARGTYL
jgi:type IV secretion/conjugal transfer VirB4 family ATPase